MIARQQEVCQEVMEQFKALYEGMKDKMVSMQESIDSKLDIDFTLIDQENDRLVTDDLDQVMFSTPRKIK